MNPASTPSPAPGRTPALVLVFLAPLLAEVLPGATRLSSLFVFPIEMCVWGGGALLIREAARRWDLGWRNVLCLALALSVAEECIIQQTSLAPMVIQIKGQVYARAFGVNYVYLLWALAYETVFVVFLPIQLAELIFPRWRREPWLGRVGLVLTPALFAVGSFLAWFTWTQIARTKVFHQPAFNPPLVAVATALVAIISLVFAAVGPCRAWLARGSSPRPPPSPWVLGLAGGLWAVPLYGLVLLGFGVAPAFPPALAVVAGVGLVIAALLTVPRWSAHPAWERRHAFGLVFGTMLGAMLVSFVGFIGAARMDLYFKIIVDLAAVGYLSYLSRRLRSGAGS
ncbi:MAG TPA: hypothetical protein VG936_11440 [Lacunisphaera sp.]|nr:hypothetical protein [Lacunisphaera sp.]